jgi:LysM repeat protein
LLVASQQLSVDNFLENTEVLMGRYGRRISRSLIGALIITVVVGLTFYLKNLASTRAESPVAASPVGVSPPGRTAPTPPRLRPEPATQPLPATRPTREVVSVTPPTSLPASSADPLADAIALKNAGKLLEAREMLNAALLSGRLSPGHADTARKALAEVNQTVVFSPQFFASDEFGGTYAVQSGDVLQKIANRHEVPWELLLRLNGMTDPKKLRAGQVLKVMHGPFNAVVYKSRFALDVYLGPPEQPGSLYITSFPVGLGKDDSTPTGTWQVEAGRKLKNPTYYSPRGEGLIDADDPKNPLGERWIGLTGIDGHAVGKASYGIHGTIDESSIGKMESMGCIRLKNADVEWLFDLLMDGKSVVVVKE